MSNQVLLWGMLVIPWLTLFFMPKKDRKRWMPAALFIIVTSTIIQDAGLTMKMFEMRENVIPFRDQLPMAYGLMPVATMWILQYTYGRFWLYALLELILGFVFAYALLPWLSLRGTQVWIKATALSTFLPSIPHFIAIYLFQMWQEGIFVRSEKGTASTNLQPAAAKPVDQGRDEEKK